MKEHIQKLFTYKEKVTFVDFMINTALHQKKCKEICSFVNATFQNYDFEIKRNDKYDFTLFIYNDEFKCKIELVRLLKRVFKLSIQINNSTSLTHISKNDNFEEILTSLYNECISKKAKIS